MNLSKLLVSIAPALFASLALGGPARALDETDLQSAIDNCSGTTCRIDICDKTYTFSMTGGVSIDGDNDPYEVIIEGCGWGKSLIERNGDSGASGGFMIKVHDGAEVVMRDFKISYKETCSANCGSSQSPKPMVKLEGPASLTVERVHFLTETSSYASTNDVKRLTALLAVGDGTTYASGLRVSDSRFTVGSSHGIQLSECWGCIVEGNHFEVNRPWDMDWIYMVTKDEGDGVVIRNNTFDMSVASTTSLGDADSAIAAVRLGTKTSTTDENVIITGNTFYGFPGQDYTIGIEFYHYNNAVISNNVFINGSTDGSRAIDTLGATNVDGNNANVVVGNQFRDWDPQTGDVCAIRLQTNSAGYTRSENWLFDGNIFDLPDTTNPGDMDGFCGDTDKLELTNGPNTFGENVTYDSTP